MPGDPFEIVERAVRAGVVPGAALGIVSRNGVIGQRVFGFAALVPESHGLQLEAQFDLASLTKVLFTLRAALRAVEDGLFDLDTRLVHLLPEVSGGMLGDCTPRTLLAHTSGLPASVDLYRWSGTLPERKARLLGHDWQPGPAVYSDIGYLIMGMLLEQVRGSSIWNLPPEEGLTFAPDPVGSVSTESCPWRGRTLRGEVHDENASSLEGRAGHAGLFGRLKDVVGACSAMLHGTWLSSAAIEEMCLPHANERALGWERKHFGWSGGSLSGQTAIGHTGFTGTGCWIDLERGLAWVLLTNAVHPSRGDASALIMLRRAVGNAVNASHA